MEIINATAAELLLGAMRADCICLTGALSDQSLPGHGQVTWTVTLTTCDYVGEVRRSVWIERDGKRILSLPVRYRVVPPLYAEPPFASVGWITDDPGHATVEIRTSGEAPVRILDVTSSRDGVTATAVRDCVSAGAPGRICVSVGGGLEAGELQATLTVHTDSADVPTIRIPVQGEAGAPVGLPGSAAAFGDMELRSAATLEVPLRGAAEIRGVRASGDAVEVAEVCREPGKSGIRLRIRDQAPLGTFQGFVSVETFSDGQARTLRIPYWGRIAERSACASSAKGTSSCCGAR